VPFFSPVLVPSEEFNFLSNMVSRLRIVLGSKDPVCPLRLAQSFNDSFEGSTLRVVEKAGHQLPHEVVREEILGLIEN
jgi:predicted esterase